MRGGVVTAALGVALLAVGTAGAGEIVLQDGQRIDGELVGQPLRVSTASGPVDVAADDVVLLAAGELLLKDGRVVTGALLPGAIRAQTPGGEVTVEASSLESYRAGSRVPPRDWTAGGAAAHGAGHGGTTPGADAGSAADMPALTAYQGTPLPPVPSAAPIQANLPSVTPYQSTATLAPAAGQEASSTGPTLTVAQPEGNPRPSAGPRIVEVLGGESALLQDAYSKARQIGRVAPGQPLLLVDSIDRRLRIMNAVVFDGGQWVKVRVADGTEGWLPAASIRDVR